jgi:hypothetical protein
MGKAKSKGAYNTTIVRRRSPDRAIRVDRMVSVVRIGWETFGRNSAGPGSRVRETCEAKTLAQQGFVRHSKGFLSLLKELGHRLIYLLGFATGRDMPTITFQFQDLGVQQTGKVQCRLGIDRAIF